MNPVVPNVPIVPSAVPSLFWVLPNRVCPGPTAGHTDVDKQTLFSFFWLTEQRRVSTLKQRGGYWVLLLVLLPVPKLVPSPVPSAPVVDLFPNSPPPAGLALKPAARQTNRMS